MYALKYFLETKSDGHVRVEIKLKNRKGLKINSARVRLRLTRVRKKCIMKRNIKGCKGVFTKKK